MNRRDLMVDAAVSAALIAFCVADRLLLTHWPNATPILAAALFAGFFLRRSWLAIAVPIVALLITDPIKGMYEPGAMAVNYLAMATPIVFRPLLRDRLSALRVGGTAVGSALIFFIISNFGVWLFTPMYSKSAAGLVECYLMALPFLKYAVAGAIGWSAVFFGAWSLSKRALTSGRGGEERIQPAAPSSR